MIFRTPRVPSVLLSLVPEMLMEIVWVVEQLQLILKRHQMYVEHITLYIYPRIRILDSQVRTCQHKTNLKGRSLSRVCDAGCRIG